MLQKRWAPHFVEPRRAGPFALMTRVCCACVLSACDVYCVHAWSVGVSLDQRCASAAMRVASRTGRIHRASSCARVCLWAAQSPVCQWTLVLPLLHMQSPKALETRVNGWTGSHGHAAKGHVEPDAGIPQQRARKHTVTGGGCPTAQDTMGLSG